MNKCVQCGFCCRQGVCTFGVWDVDKCRYLGDDDRCTVYDLIKNMPGADVNPAFGAGCSSPLFNERRREKLHAMDDHGLGRKNGPGQGSV